MTDAPSSYLRDIRELAGLGQRELAEQTGIPQTTLSRIENGTRQAKANELLSLAWALGTTVAELIGQSPVRDRARFAARAEEGAGMDAMRAELLFYLELDAYLENQGISARR